MNDSRGSGGFASGWVPGAESLAGFPFSKGGDRMQTGVSYFSSRDPRHVRADLADMVEHGCTYVVHCLTETDLAFNFQGMAEIVRATRDLGLEPWASPWGVGGVFSGETFSRFLLDHPESWQIRSDGRAIPAACPRDPSMREYLRGWIARAAEMGARVLLWDAPHFHVDWALPDEKWTCLCPLCQDAYSDRYRGRMPAAFTEEVREFRERTLLDLLADLCRAGHRAGLRNALCLLPSDLAAHGFVEAERRFAARLNRRRTQQGLLPLEGVPTAIRFFGVSDWEAAAAIPEVDIFGCHPSWYAFEAEPRPFVETYVAKTLRAARRAADLTRRPRQTQMWLQGFTVPSGRERELFGAVKLAARMGVSHVAAWSYGGGAGMSYTRSERPEAVWSVLGEAFRAVRHTRGAG